MSWNSYYDASTDKIMNCKKNTLGYYHEEAHRKQNKSGVLGILEIFTFESLIISVFFISFKLYILGQIISIITIILYAIPEIHAWIYAYKKMRRKNGKSL